MFENRKRDNMEIKEILHKYQSERSLRHKIHSLLLRADARGTADIILPYLTHIASLRVGISIDMEK